MKPPFSYGFSYGFPMISPFSYGFPMVFLWFSYGFTKPCHPFPPFSEVRLGEGGAIDVPHHRHGGSVADHPAVGAGGCAATEVPDTWRR